MLLFTIIPGIPHVAVDGEISPPAFANRSVVPGATVVIDLDISPPTIVNVSTVTGARLTTGDEFDIEPPIITNSSTVDSAEVDEAPPDAVISPPQVVNTSTIDSAEVDEAPPDEALRPVQVVNSSTVDSATVQLDNFSGAGTAAGVGAATAVGNRTAAATGISAGVGAATAVGNRTAAAAGASAGIGAATAVGDVAADENGTLISTLTATGGATLAWTGLSGTSWRLVARLLLPATNADRLRIRFGTGAGPTYITSGYDYDSGLGGSGGFGAASGAESQSTSFLSTINIPNSQPGVTVDIQIDTDNANWVRFTGTSNHKSTDTHWYNNHVGGGVALSAPLTAIELSFSGNMTSGNASLHQLPT